MEIEMSSITIASVSFACIFAGMIFGLFIGYRAPEHHLSDKVKDTVKLGAGIIATMAALVLGLLVGSSKSSFDAMDTGINEMAAKTILLDRVLAQYGPEAKDVGPGFETFS